MTRRGRKALDGLVDDLRDHIERQTEENLARGMTPDAARRQARLALGNTALIEEDARAVWVSRWLEDLRRDLRYALRTFRRSPGFAATAVVSLAVGIAAAAGVFSIVNAALLNPFPFADIDRIVRLDLNDSGKPRGLSFTARQLVALQHSDVFDGAFAWNTWEMTLTGQDFPEAVGTQYFSANGLDVLGVPPLLGRVFNEADGPAGEQPQRVVVLTYRFWQRHFGGQPDAVGQTLYLNREPYTVIGVLPRQYFHADAEILVPIRLTFDPNFAWRVQARLKRGVDPRMAEQRLQPLFDQFAREAPQRFPKEARPLVRSLVETQRAAGFVPPLLLIFAASLLLLLLACANVSILLLARGTSRAHEFAVRAAIGASRGRLMRQLLVESLLLAFSGAVLGVAAGYWGLPAILRLLPPDSVPVGNLIAVPVNVPVLLFSGGLAMASALISGLSPALFLSRPRLTATARTTGVESRRAHHILLAAQIALTVLLLVGTGAAVRGLIGLYRTSLGYDPRHVIIASITLPDRSAPTTSHTEWADRATFYERLRNRMADVPQVESVALATFGIPPESGQWSVVVEVPGRDMTGYETPIVQRISANYFATMKIPLIRGRVWSDSESAGTPHVAVVNQTMARELWPDESAIGRRVRMPDYVKSSTYFRLAAPGSDGWFEIVGIVGNTPNVGLHEPPAPSIYVPYTLMLGDSLNVILRTSHDPLSMTRSIREAVRTVDPNQPVNVYTAEGALASAGWASERFVTLLLLGFAMFALMLAVVGLYSVVSYSVSCRFKEFGIRMALGAGRGRIVNAAVQPAVLAIVAGLFAGLASSVGLNKIVAQWSIGNLNDPVVLVAVSLVLCVAAMMSAAIPANRAASIRPADAVRID
ncbi:MAG TPA: ABC transporter permease [Vicinamibacterales bacterium]|nr:ABC transporter permease [Vicinamibacterales bacterium]